MYDYERMLMKPAANDVEKPWPPAAERRIPSPCLERLGEIDCPTAPVEGERLAA